MSFPFRKLALGGGGVKGVLHLGALIELSKHQDLYFPDGVYGSSIGAIFAVCVAFQLNITENFLDDKTDFFAIQKLVPNLDFESLQHSFSEKGVFTMDIFTKILIDIFKKSNLDFETLKIKDAKMPLYIFASNITKGIPTIFTGDVTIIDALRCSCCIPFLYKPQELYGQLYIDGDIFMPYIGSLEKDAFIIRLKTQTYTKINPKTVQDIPLLTYVREVYNMGVNSTYKLCQNDTTLELAYPNLLAESDLNDFDIPDILRVSSESMRGFLISKSFLKELPKVISTGSTNHLE